MKINPWAFGILFLITVCILMLSNFKIPFSFTLKESKSADALIINSKRVLGKLPHTKNLYVDIIFKTEDTTYLSNLLLSGEFIDLNIGDSIKINYQIGNPLNNKFEKAYHNIQNNFLTQNAQRKFLYNKDVGFKELYLSKNVFKLSEYVEYGKVKSRFIGTYKIINDTLTLSPLLEYRNNKYQESSSNSKLSDFLITYDDKYFEIKTQQKYN